MEKQMNTVAKNGNELNQYLIDKLDAIRKKALDG